MHIAQTTYIIFVVHIAQTTRYNVIVIVHIAQATYIQCNSLFVCFVALRPKSTAIMVIAGRSVHLTTLFPGLA